LTQEQAYLGWDKGLEYKDEKESLEHWVKSERNRKFKSYFVILLIQLRNASRISEAIEAFQFWCKNGKNEQRVRTRKRKPKNEFKRLMIIPKEVRKYKQLRKVSKEWPKDMKIMEDRIYRFCMAIFGYNTHALRYAGITFLSTKYKIQIVAKQTGHTTMDHILKYTQQKKADQLLRDEIE